MGSKTVFITGATGFLGGNLARALRADGMRVVGHGRNRDALARLARDGIETATGSLHDPAAVGKLIEGADFVVHSAALSSPWGTFAEFHRANVEVTEILADAALASSARPRFVQISTPSIYTARFHRRNLREDAELPAKKISGYGETKWLAEVALDRRIARGLWAVKLRPLNIVGPGDATVLPRLLRLAERGILPVLPEGDAETDLTPIENVVAAIRASFRAPEEIRGRAYNLSNGEPISIPEILRVIHEVRGISARPKRIHPGFALAFASANEWMHRRLLAGREPKVTVQALCALIYSRSLNIEAARRDLDYRPVGGTREILRRLVAEKKNELF